MKSFTSDQTNLHHVEISDTNTFTNEEISSSKTIDTKYGEKLNLHFTKFPVLLPVIHLSSVEQSLRNARLCFSIEGIDGIILIAHSHHHQSLSSLQLTAQCYAAIRNEFPNRFIGVNVLKFQHAPLEVFDWVMKNCPGCQCIQTDQAWACVNKNLAKRILEARIRSGFSGIYMGGVAFKYQERVHEMQDATPELPIEAIKALKHAGSLTTKYVDVVITSGTKTGDLPCLEKAKTLNSVCQPLAVSGAGEYLEDFAPFAQVFLSATFLSKECPKHGIIDSCDESFCELDEEKLRKWVQRRNNYLLDN
ncbi:hypothetical protein C9374_011913 [Naegleria lovaniensis]|uniref:Uncharacterized protein n=1 Tax=Naegleria lovaniensis TaxID=51637 RepID=A0AA88KED0_NAELO|nr:uncharacterized protein C9374_011913 [Naegleria lovaniensis]KAG2373624.1 hypothetical protein C9374_011913 [Naegleria lovaniensis]